MYVKASRSNTEHVVFSGEGRIASHSRTRVIVCVCGGERCTMASYYKDSGINVPWNLETLDILEQNGYGGQGV